MVTDAFVSELEAATRRYDERTEQRAESKRVIEERVVEESAEPITTLDPTGGRSRTRLRGRWRAQVKRPVWTLTVVAGEVQE